MAKPILDATLTWRDDINDTLAFFRFELDGGIPDFEPGQFVTLGLPDPDPEREGKMLWRAYSIASPPSEKRWLELYIRWARRPVDGKFTTRLWTMKPGDTLKHRGVTGPFTVEQERPDGSPDQRRLLLVGGGTGLAPFVSYAVEFERVGIPRELVICHGASYVDELGYRDTLERMQRETADRGPGAFKVRYVPTISRPTEEKNAEWTGETGRVETLLQTPEDGGRSRIETILDADLTPDHFFCHVCGYDNTCKATAGVLEPKGFRSRRQKREDGSYDLKVESYG